MVDLMKTGITSEVLKDHQKTLTLFQSCRPKEAKCSIAKQNLNAAMCAFVDGLLSLNKKLAGEARSEQ